MKKLRTVLIGLGTVNIGLLKILLDKKQMIAEKHHLELVIVGVADSSGIAVSANGYQYAELVNLKAKGDHVNRLDGYLQGISTEIIVDHVDAQLLIEGSPVNLETGNPGLQVMRTALIKGWSVVTANKAPLVLAFDELHMLAQKHSGKLAYSATVCGGLPVINVLLRDLKATTLITFKGILNATTNFILGELEKGGSFEEAVGEAQRIGAAEADPSLDIDGYDTANKLFIIMKSFTDFSGDISDIQIKGIRNIDEKLTKQACARNHKIKLVGMAEMKDDQWILVVTPIEVQADSFLGSCNGWEMGIDLATDYYENISMKTSEAEPAGTSAAVLRDVINLSLN